MLTNYFQQFGRITNCRVFNSYSKNPKQMGYAFLRFEDYDSVGK
jgi:RNA recognition motif-containing protein